MGGGGKMPYVSAVFSPRHAQLLTEHDRYPKHVWSPAGGWYSQPANWKTNTAVTSLVIFGITALVFKYSADHEYRPRMPEKDRFFPSR